MSLNESQEFFSELLFGEYGGWLGLILVLAVIFLASQKNKYLGVCFLPVLIFLGIKYMSMVATSSNFYWSVLICMVGSVLLLLQMAKQK